MISTSLAASRTSDWHSKQESGVKTCRPHLFRRTTQEAAAEMVQAAGLREEAPTVLG